MLRRNVVIKLATYFLVFFLFLSLPKVIFASTVTNQPDGTFLIDGQPFFPIGFWANNNFSGYNVNFEIPLSDWQDLAGSGINFTMFPYWGVPTTTDPTGDFNKLVTQANLKVAYATNYDDPNFTVPNANRFGSNLLMYFALDEPEIALNCNLDSAKGQLYPIYQLVANSDPNHPIWSNHSINVCGQDTNQWRTTVNTWNINTKTTVNGLDFYSPAAGDNEGSWTAWTKQTSNSLAGQIGKNVGTLMIISGYYDRFGGYTFEDRLFNAVTSIFNGTNGLMFYTDDTTWATYRPTAAYTQVKQVASVVKNASPGILGKNLSVALSPSGSAKALLRQGADNRYYLFLENPSSSTVSFTVNQIPASGNYTELATNQTVNVASGSLSVSLAPWAARVYRQIPTQTGLPGDLNSDGKVDILDLNQFLANPTSNFDYNLVIANYGKTSTISTTIVDLTNILANWGNTTCGNVADLNKDCKVDNFDYNVLVANYGR